MTFYTTFVCISCKFKAKLIKHCDLSSRFNQNTCFFSRHKFFIGFKRGLHYAGFLFFMMSEASTYTRSDTMKPKLFGIQRSVFQTFWKLHCSTKSLFFELETSNCGYFLIFFISFNHAKFQQDWTSLVLDNLCLI